MKTLRFAAVLSVAAIAVVANGTATAGAGTPAEVGPPAAAAPLVELTPIATLAFPTSAAPASRHPGGPMYVAEREGTIRIMWPGGHVTGPVVDLTALTTTEGERGLHGIATNPDRTWLYISYTGLEGESLLERAPIIGRKTIGPRERLLTVPEQQFYHNGGQVIVDESGLVYWGLGDGGGPNDPFENAQDLSTLQGSILRMRPDGRAVRSNPFVGVPGRDRIWLYGVRNPWRFTIDPRTGDLLIGDVGQSTSEEITFLTPEQQPGANLGWKCWEGTFKVHDCEAPGHVPPVYEHPRETDSLCAITGGYRYRGATIPDLAGRYVYSDFCDGTLRYLVRRSGVMVDRSLGLDAGSVLSFAEDAGRELYVLTASGTVYRLDPG